MECTHSLVKYMDKIHTREFAQMEQKSLEKMSQKMENARSRHSCRASCKYAKYADILQKKVSDKKLSR